MLYTIFLKFKNDYDDDVFPYSDYYTTKEIANKMMDKLDIMLYIS